METSPLRTVSAVQALAAELRQLILDGVLEPGERLREAEYARKYVVGRQTFRAATQVLCQQGLLRSLPNRGVMVPLLTADDVADVFRLRSVLESAAFASVVGSGAVPDAAVAAVREMSGLAADAPWRDVVGGDVRFHRALIDAAGSPRLARAYEAVQSEVVLCMVQLRPRYDNPGQVAEEHEQLLELIRAGDVTKAQAGLTVHLQDAERNLTSAFSGSGDTSDSASGTDPAA